MSLPAFAACTTPAGNSGDVVYSSVNNVMAYCNGTSWISMGASQPVGFGTLTNTDFCTATSATTIACNTPTIPASSITAIAGLSVLGTATTTAASPGAITGTANQTLVVNSGGTGLAFGALNLASSAAVTGILANANGGTGTATYSTGDILYASAANTLSRLAAGTNGNILTLAGGVPVWAAAPASGVTSFSAGTTGLTPASASTGAIVLAGTLGVANGGTGLATLTSNVIYKGNGTGVLAVSGLTDNGTIVSFSESIDATGKSYITEIANGSVATVLNTLAKLDTSGNATKALATDTDGIVGIVVGGAGTTGTTAQIAIDGQATCSFDGTAVVGHFVTISSTTAGDCHDAGATRSTTAQTIGRVLTGGTTATVALGLNGVGGGAASGSTGYVQFNNSGAFLGTSNLFWDNTNNRLGIGSAIPTVGLDLSQKTDAIALPIGTTGTRPTCSVGVNGALRYNSTIPAVEACVNGAWVSVGAGGGQLLGSYSSGTAVTNNSVVFTGAAGSAPSFSGTTLTLASNTAYITVEVWGGGGGGGGSGNGGGGGNGGSSCFGTNSTACTTPAVQAAGGNNGSSPGSAGTPCNGAGAGSGGSVTSGDVSIAGQGGGVGEGIASGSYSGGGGQGGGAPGGGGGSRSSGAGSAGGTGNAFGGGGAGGGGSSTCGGGGGGGGSYSGKFVNNPSGTYFYTVGSGGAGGSAGTLAGGAGGAGGIKVTAYSSGSTQAFNVGTQATGTLGVANGGTGTTTPFTQGSVVFSGASGVYSQDNSNFFYDATNHRLGIGTTGPIGPLEVYGSVDYGASTNAPAVINAVNTTSNSNGAPIANFLAPNNANPWITIGSSTSTNNSATPGFAYVGNGSANNYFYVGLYNQTPALVVNGSGFVGIGTTAPASPLEVSTAAGTLARVADFITPSMTNNQQNYIAIGNAVSSNNGFYFAYNHNSTAASRWLGIQPFENSPGTGGIVLTAAGNVGIGTTGPSNALVAGTDIGAGSVAANTIAVGNASGNSTFLLGQDSTNRGRLFWNYNATPSSAYMVLGTKTSAQNLVLQDQGGNVGIGTTSPGYLLTVGSTDTVSNPQIGVGLGGAASNYALGISGGRMMLGYDDTLGMGIFGGGSGKGFKFYVNGTNNSWESGTQAVTISSSGLVGIGTTSPGAMLFAYGSGSGAAPATSGTTDATMNLRAGRGSVSVDIGMMDSGTAYIQNRLISNFATDFNIALEPNGGFVGIGTTLPASPLTVASTSTVATAGQENAVSINKSYTVADSGNKNGMAVSTGATLASGTLSTGVNGILSVAAAGGGNVGTIVGAAAYWARVDNNNSGGGTLTNAYGLLVNDSGGAGAPVNQYGVYVNGLGKGSATNYAIYTAGTTPSYFGGNVGIGTTGPLATLDVVGSIYSRSNNAGSATSINWATSNVASTTASCGAFTFTNMQDGGSYTLAVQGTTAGTCSFSQSGLTFRSSQTLTSTASTQTVFTFIRVGSTVYVSMIAGT